jgi:hypothetical protein
VGRVVRDLVLPIVLRRVRAGGLARMYDYRVDWDTAVERAV